MIDSLQSVIIK